MHVWPSVAMNLYTYLHICIHLSSCVLMIAMDLHQNVAAKLEIGNGKGGKRNLAAFTWAHAVNGQKQLTDALNSNIDFIEADIVMGKIYNSGNDLPIMAHPPASTSDLSLDSFLLQIKVYNENNPKEMKGVKLDFKSIEVFEDAMETLKLQIPQMICPIWLNADIIKGPVNATHTKPVNPDTFLAGCAQFERAVLSIGWTTSWTSTPNNGSYTYQETAAMLEAIKINNVTKTRQVITFPVRAGIAANSLRELQDLLYALEDTNECTLTIWSSPNDFVNVDKLRNLIFSMGLDRVYLDIPEELSCRLNLSPPDHIAENIHRGSSPALYSFLHFSLISIGIILISSWMKKV